MSTLYNSDSRFNTFAGEYSEPPRFSVQIDYRAVFTFVKRSLPQGPVAEQITESPWNFSVCGFLS
jgi:hypothetical protein